MIKRILLFLVLNFSALAIGGLFTGKGVPSDWYQNLNQAPWTPPGWMFGVAWTFIMICFAVYMTYLVSTKVNIKKVILLYLIQWVLNVAWNPLFFHYQAVLVALINISLLTTLVAFFLFNHKRELETRSLLIAPYFIWLLIATSLNAYILIYN
jgi:translocator protein